MSAPKFGGEPMTKREVLIAREAYANGWDDVHDIGCKRASELYPLPKVTRPRVVRDPEWPVQEWRFVEGAFQCRQTNAANGFLRWIDYKETASFAPVPERVQMWADLLANPTEEVEEGA